MAFKSKLWSYEFEPRVGDGDFDLVMHSDGKRVYAEVYFPDGDTSDVSNLRVKIDKKLFDFDETEGDAIFLVNVGALPEREGYIENAMKFVNKTPKLSGILFYEYNLNLIINQQPTNEIIIRNYWFKSPMKNIFEEVLDTVSGFKYKFYDYPKYDFSHNRISSTEK